MRRQPREELDVKLLIMGYPKRLAGLPFFVHRDEHGKLLVGIASDKLFHIAAVPPFQGVLLAVYAKPRCSAFIASLSATNVSTLKLVRVGPSTL